MKFLRLYLSVFILFLFGYQGMATHLVGGSMSYEYLGRQGNGNYRYRVTVKMYRDCTGSNSVPFDQSITIGIYNNDPQRTFSRSTTLSMISKSLVNPPSGGSDCSFQPPVCLEQAIYQGTIDLTQSTAGYHMVYQRCCRNTQVNILDNLGQTYYAMIPPTAIANNSPFFTEVPAPYICVNDLISLVNTARDVDGDSLVYQLATPWTAGSDNDPMPSLPGSWPQIPNFDPVTYKSGYNVNIPFGATGVANINSRNGVTELLSPRVGRFSIAVDVYEYRNEVLISRIRLDIQMIVINCDPNLIPTITTNSTNSFEVIEGEQICFDVESKDGDNDNLKLSGSGDPLTGTGPGFGNLATFATKSGASTVTSTFCWTPSCGRASTSPYLVTFESQDDGCPPKRRLLNVSILVKPFIGITSMNGPDQVCANQGAVVYSVSGAASSTFQWTVDGGVINSGQGGQSISVTWGAGPTGKVTVFETSGGGCGGNKDITKDVTILPAPSLPVISGKDTVCEFTASTYSVPAVTGNNYIWTVNGGTINGASNGSSINVNWLAKGSGSVSVIQVNQLGCASDTGVFTVSKQRSEIDSLYGSSSVCPNIRGVEYAVYTPNPGSTYIWTVNGGTQASGANTSRITVDWGGIGNGYVEVYEISRFNCVSEPVRVNVTINHVLQGMVPRGDDTLCELSKGIKYDVTYTNRSIYNWSITNGTIVQDDQSNTVLVDWGNSGVGELTVQEISFDSINNIPCIGIPRTLKVYLAPYPVENPIVGPDELCQSTLEQLFYITGMTGSSYEWAYSGTSAIKGQGNDSIYLVPDAPGNFIISTKETSVYGCAGPVVSKSFIVHPRPVTKGIFGDNTICFPRYNDQLYAVEGFATSDFQWTVNGASIVSGQGSDSLIISFTGQPDNKISVTEITEFGCKGDTLKMDVFADNPSIDLKVISVMVGDDSKMEVAWELVNAPRYNAGFEVQRRVAGTGISNWVNAGFTPGTQLTFTDKSLKTDDLIYEYRIIGYNLCGDTLYSDVHRNVQIKGSKFFDDEYAVSLLWSNYLGWNDGVNFYELYRKDGNGDYILLNNTGSDTSDSYTDGTKSFRHCYMVKATENSGKEVSWSNEICFTFDPILLVPNAFTPNGDGINTNFEMVSASIKTYTITIYDRWGEIIYEGNDVSRFWDGTYRGKPVQEGVYVYMIRYTGHDDRPKFLRGNVTVLR